MSDLLAKFTLADMVRTPHHSIHQVGSSTSVHVHPDSLNPGTYFTWYGRVPNPLLGTIGPDFVGSFWPARTGLEKELLMVLKFFNCSYNLQLFKGTVSRKIRAGHSLFFSRLALRSFFNQGSLSL